MRRKGSTRSWRRFRPACGSSTGARSGCDPGVRKIRGRVGPGTPRSGSGHAPRADALDRLAEKDLPARRRSGRSESPGNGSGGEPGGLQGVRRGRNVVGAGVRGASRDSRPTGANKKIGGTRRLPLYQRSARGGALRTGTSRGTGRAGRRPPSPGTNRRRSTEATRCSGSGRSCRQQCCYPANRSWRG